MLTPCARQSRASRLPLMNRHLEHRKGLISSPRASVTAASQEFSLNAMTEARVRALSRNAKTQVCLEPADPLDALNKIYAPLEVSLCSGSFRLSSLQESSVAALLLPDTGRRSPMAKITSRIIRMDMLRVTGVSILAASGAMNTMGASGMVAV